MEGYGDLEATVPTVDTSWSGSLRGEGDGWRSLAVAATSFPDVSAYGADSVAHPYGLMQCP